MFEEFIQRRTDIFQARVSENLVPAINHMHEFGRTHFYSKFNMITTLVYKFLKNSKPEPWNRAAYFLTQKNYEIINDLFKTMKI